MTSIRFFFCLFIAAGFLLTNFDASAAERRPSTTPLFVSQSLELWFQNQVTYQACPTQTGVTKKQMRSLFENSVRHGLNAVYKVNKSLVNDRLLRARNRPVIIDCKRTKDTAFAEVIDASTWFKERRAIHAGRPLLDKTHSREFWRMIMFHEFLHVMGFDNFETETHNDRDFLFELSPDYEVSGAEMDVVYSCAAIAYPEAVPYLTRFLRGPVAFETCSKARVDPRTFKVVVGIPASPPRTYQITHEDFEMCFPNCPPAGILRGQQIKP